MTPGLTKEKRRQLQSKSSGLSTEARSALDEHKIKRLPEKPGPHRIQVADGLMLRRIALSA
jgi:hypothetical protein